MLLANIGLIHLEQKNYTKATEYLFESIQRRENLGQYNENYLTYNNLGVIHRRRGDYEQAYQHCKLYRTVSDSLLNIQRADRINEMQIRFDVVEFPIAKTINRELVSEYVADK